MEQVTIGVFVAEVVLIVHLKKELISILYKLYISSSFIIKNYLSCLPSGLVIDICAVGSVDFPVF